MHVFSNSSLPGWQHEAYFWWRIWSCFRSSFWKPTTFPHFYDGWICCCSDRRSNIPSATTASLKKKGFKLIWIELRVWSCPYTINDDQRTWSEFSICFSPLENQSFKRSKKSYMQNIIHSHSNGNAYTDVAKELTFFLEWNHVRILFAEGFANAAKGQYPAEHRPAGVLEHDDGTLARKKKKNYKFSNVLVNFRS